MHLKTISKFEPSLVLKEQRQDLGDGAVEGIRAKEREEGKGSAAKQVLRAGLEALAGAGTVLEGIIRNSKSAFRAWGRERSKAVA